MDSTGGLLRERRWTIFLHSRRKISLPAGRLICSQERICFRKTWKIVLHLQTLDRLETKSINRTTLGSHEDTLMSVHRYRYEFNYYIMHCLLVVPKTNGQ
jgi:hypothetical protein